MENANKRYGMSKLLRLSEYAAMLLEMEMIIYKALDCIISIVESSFSSKLPILYFDDWIIIWQESSNKV